MGFSEHPFVKERSCRCERRDCFFINFVPNTEVFAVGLEVFVETGVEVLESCSLLRMINVGISQDLVGIQYLEVSK